MPKLYECSKVSCKFANVTSNIKCANPEGLVSADPKFDNVFV